MNIFKQLEQSKADLDILYSRLTQSQRNLEEISAAVFKRIEDNRNKIQARISELTEQINDASRSSVIRSIAETEREKLKNQTFFAFPEEINAFDAEYETALKILSETRKALSDVAQSAREAISAIGDLKTDRAKKEERLPIFDSSIKKQKDNFDKLRG